MIAFVPSKLAALDDITVAGMPFDVIEHPNAVDFDSPTVHDREHWV
jgi:hypothetical protein